MPFKVIQSHRRWYQSNADMRYLAPFPSYGWLLVTFSLARGECLTLTLSRSRGWLPANIAISDISLKTRFFGLHFRCRKCWCIFNHFYAIRPESYRIRWNFLLLGLLRRSRSSKVTEFGTNRKRICDVLLVISSNLALILHRFREIAFDSSRSEFTFASAKIVERIWGAGTGWLDGESGLEEVRL